MIAYRMSFLLHTSHQFGMCLCLFANQEEGCLQTVTFQQIEELGGALWIGTVVKR